MSASYSSSSSSVEDVQDSFDSLMLAIFEAVRSHEQASILSADEKSTIINENYLKVTNHINNLNGSNSTKNQQEKRLKELFETYLSLRSDILTVETDMQDFLQIVDSELAQKLADDTLGVSSTTTEEEEENILTNSTTNK